jgi:hypothetical protein
VPRNNTAGFAAGRSVAAAAYLTDGRTVDRPAIVSLTAAVNVRASVNMFAAV